MRIVTIVVVVGGVGVISGLLGAGLIGIGIGGGGWCGRRRRERGDMEVMRGGGGRDGIDSEWTAMLMRVSVCDNRQRRRVLHRCNIRRRWEWVRQVVLRHRARPRTRRRKRWREEVERRHGGCHGWEPVRRHRHRLLGDGGWMEARRSKAIVCMWGEVMDMGSVCEGEGRDVWRGREHDGAGMGVSVLQGGGVG